MIQLASFLTYIKYENKGTTITTVISPCCVCQDISNHEAKLAQVSISAPLWSWKETALERQSNGQECASDTMPNVTVIPAMIFPGYFASETYHKNSIHLH